jgi:proteasome lid subunit RPN8/RPN11
MMQVSRGGRVQADDTAGAGVIADADLRAEIDPLDEEIRRVMQRERLLPRSAEFGRALARGPGQLVAGIGGTLPALGSLVGQALDVAGFHPRIGQALRSETRVIGQPIAKVGQAATELFPPSMEPDLPAELIGVTGEVLSQLGQQVALAASTAGAGNVAQLFAFTAPNFARVVGSQMEGQRSRIDAGELSADQAAGAAVLAGTLESLIEMGLGAQALVFRRFPRIFGAETAKRMTANRLFRAAGTGAVESFEEIVQEVSTATVQRLAAEDPDAFAQLPKRIALAAFGGAVGGTVAGAVTPDIRGRAERESQRLEAELQNRLGIETLEREAEAAAAQPPAVPTAPTVDLDEAGELAVVDPTGLAQVEPDLAEVEARAEVQRTAPAAVMDVDFATEDDLVSAVDLEDVDQQIASMAPAPILSPEEAQKLSVEREATAPPPAPVEAVTTPAERTEGAREPTTTEREVAGAQLVAPESLSSQDVVMMPVARLIESTPFPGPLPSVAPDPTARQPAFDPAQVGVITAYRDEDGRARVIDGNKRVQSAREADVELLPVRFLRGVESFEEAQAVGELINAAEGNRTAVQVAEVLRRTGVDPVDAGLDVGRPDIRDAIAIARIPEPLFKRVQLGQYSPERAIAIGATGLNERQMTELEVVVGSHDLSVSQMQALVDIEPGFADKLGEQLEVDNVFNQAEVRAAIQDHFDKSARTVQLKNRKNPQELGRVFRRLAGRNPIRRVIREAAEDLSHSAGEAARVNIKAAAIEAVERYLEEQTVAGRESASDATGELRVEAGHVRTADGYRSYRAGIFRGRDQDEFGNDIVLRDPEGRLTEYLPPGKAETRANAINLVRNLAPMVKGGTATSDQRAVYEEAIEILAQIGTPTLANRSVYGPDLMPAPETEIEVDDTLTDEQLLDEEIGIAWSDDARFHEMLDFVVEAGGPYVNTDPSDKGPVTPENLTRRRKRALKEARQEAHENRTAFINIPGSVVKTVTDLANLLRVMRSPFVENMTVTLMKGGQVVANGAYTSGSPVTVRPSNSLMWDVLRAAQKHGADRVVFSHNHPTGNPEPSTADAEFTRNVAHFFASRGIRATEHIILNDGRAIYLLASGQVVHGKELVTDSNPGDWTKQQFRGIRAALDAVASPGPGKFQMFHMNNATDLLAVETFDSSAVDAARWLGDKGGFVGERIRRWGAQGVIIVVDSRDDSAYTRILDFVNFGGLAVSFHDQITGNDTPYYGVLDIVQWDQQRGDVLGGAELFGELTYVDDQDPRQTSYPELEGSSAQPIRAKGGVSLFLEEEKRAFRSIFSRMGGGVGGVRASRPGGPNSGDPGFDTWQTFEDQDAQKAFESQKGLPPTQKKEALSLMRRILSGFFHTFDHIDTKKRLSTETGTAQPTILAAVQDLLRQLRANSEFSKLAARWNIQQILRDLNPTQYQQFTGYLVLQDALRSVEESGITEWTPELLFNVTRFPIQSLDQLHSDFARHEAAVQADPALRAALEKRAEFVARLVNMLVKHDLLPVGVLDDPRYWHRQVLAHFESREAHFFGTGGSGIRMARKGFQRARVEQVEGGAEFNTRYAESELEWVAQAFAQLNMKTIHDRLGSMVNIGPALQRDVKVRNELAFKEKFGLEAMELLAQPARLIAQSNRELAKLAADGKLSAGPYQHIADALGQRWLDWEAERKSLPKEARKNQEPFRYDHAHWWEFITFLERQGGDGAQQARRIYFALAKKREIIKTGLGREYIEPQSMHEIADRAAPDGYVAYDTEEGFAFHYAFTVGDKVAQRLLQGEKVLVDQGDIRRELVRGGRRSVWIIPEELAKQLQQMEKQFVKEDTTGEAIDDVVRELTAMWKHWVLLNPFRITRYNLNNFSGDLDIALAYDPAIAGYLNQAFKDIVNFHGIKRVGIGRLSVQAFEGQVSDEVAADIMQAVNLAVMGSGLAMQELTDVNNVRFISHLEDAAAHEGGFTGWATRNLIKASDFAHEMTAIRENALRLAAFRYFRDRLRAGEVNVYGASRKHEIDAVTDPDERAAKLARELIGDYGNISVNGQYLRSRLMPFYSWMEINLPRYVRLMKNTRFEDGTGNTSRWRVTAAAGRSVALKKGALLLRAQMMMTAGYLFNLSISALLGISDEEREILQRKNNDFHIIIGRVPWTGEIRTIRLEGALSDALEWFGLQDLPEDITKLLGDEKDVLDMLAEAPKSAIDRYIGAVHPGPKTLMEYLTGTALYPSVFEEGKDISFRIRGSRDRNEQALGMFAFEPIVWAYQRATGKPMRPGQFNPINIAANLFTYGTDPGEAAYWEARSIAVAWKKNQGEESPRITPTERSNALYYYRRSLMWGDEAGAERWLRKYKELGGDTSNMRASVDRAHPYGFMTERDKGRFRESLSPEQKRIVERGIRFWNETMRGSGRRRRSSRSR